MENKKDLKIYAEYGYYLTHEDKEVAKKYLEVWKKILILKLQIHDPKAEYAWLDESWIDRPPFETKVESLSGFITELDIGTLALKIAFQRKFPKELK